MAIGKRLGVLLVSLLACGAAFAEVTCAECKATALAEASKCRAAAAPDAAMLAACDRKYNETGQGCQASVCRAEAGAAAATRCADCMKQSEADLKKCPARPADVNAACEARAAIDRKMCEERACPAAKAK